MDIAAHGDIQQQHIAACIFTCIYSLKVDTTKSDLYLCHHEFGCPSVEITFDNTNANGQNCTRFEEGKYHIIQNYINSYYVKIQALSA